MVSLDSFKVQSQITVGNDSYNYFSLNAAAKKIGEIDQLPISLKILLENLLRHENGTTVSNKDIVAVADWLKTKSSNHEVAFRPTRVLMQDFTGVPAVVDLAAMRDAIATLGGDLKQINPLSAVDLVIDHSVIAGSYGSEQALSDNMTQEYERNSERYKFLRWGQQAFNNFRVVPPGMGICHQVNLEYLAQTVWLDNDTKLVYPDSVVGADSHTTMVNSLSVLGWGVGGIEAESVMLGQPISMLIPEVFGVNLIGRLPEGTSATDLVLTITNILRKAGVVGKFVEFCGPGLDYLSLADRATIANMAPEYGATCGFFPVDQETIRYLTISGRDPVRIALVEAYARAQGLWRSDKIPQFSSLINLDLATIVPSMAGPKRPQDKVSLPDIASNFSKELASYKLSSTENKKNSVVNHGDIVIAAITSCTNTSNPSVMLGAGLLAKKAVALGLQVKPWVKTSLAPGSRVVSDYLKQAGVDKYLNALGFYTVGYGCTTCIGNSGALADQINDDINKNDLVVGAVLSGNRNFEGRVHPLVKANYLASPMLVVAYALAGSLKINLTSEPIGNGTNGQPVYLRDIWPSNAEIAAAVDTCVTAAQFNKQYAAIFNGDDLWQKVQVSSDPIYNWDKDSSYIQKPPYFEGMTKTPVALQNIHSARILGIFADSITTDHISPAGSIKNNSPAGDFLSKSGVKPEDFNQYGARRGNHQIMMRGTFANIRIKNELIAGVEGGFTKVFSKDGVSDIMPIYDAAMIYKQQQVPLVIIAGKEYGTGSSRDWAAKGTNLLGVKAVIAESFERIHRSNLVGMGVLPLTFKNGATRNTIGFSGSDVIDITGFSDNLTPQMELIAKITRSNGAIINIPLLCRIDTNDEANYFKNGGILQYVLRNMLTAR